LFLGFLGSSGPPLLSIFSQRGLLARGDELCSSTAMFHRSENQIWGGSLHMASVNVQKELCEASVSSKLPGIVEQSRSFTHTQLRHESEAHVAEVTDFPHAVPNNFGMPQSAKISCLQQSLLFRGLSTSECADIASHAREVRFDRREHIFCEGDSVASVSILVSGRVKITQLSRSGEEVILRLKDNGEVLGGLGVQPGGSHFQTAQALQSCCVLMWDSRKFEMLEERYPTLRRNTVRIFADRLRILEERFLELATEHVGCRLARTLVRLVDQGRQSNHASARIDLSREELAQMTGTTLFTVSRLLSKWGDRGILQAQRKSVLVLNRRGLVELSHESEVEQ
jgi:CRP/FNR family transcriptional regulator, nitrogen oxide reductase regulator